MAAVTAAYLFAVVFEGSAIFAFAAFLQAVERHTHGRVSFDDMFVGTGSLWLIFLAPFAFWHIAFGFGTLFSAAKKLRPPLLSKFERDLLCRAKRHFPRRSKVQVALTRHLPLGEHPPHSASPDYSSSRGRSLSDGGLSAFRAMREPGGLDRRHRPLAPNRFFTLLFALSGPGVATAGRRQTC